DSAAALAAMGLASNALKADPMPEPSRGKPGRDRDGGGRDGKPGRDRASRARDENMTTYRLAVGRNERLQPGAVVGAIANEGGLTSKQIGHIDIRSNHTLVDLPKDLDSSVMRKLSHTEIQGRPIDIRPDSGRPARPFKKGNFDKQPGDSRNFRNDRRGGANKKFSNDRFGGERSSDRY
ncbi:MAG: DbpA RNA binding domain-containing protein, partial [Brevibacterium sp.]|nr:DbpA RNA binding domain-containing protein [Brevibacterium sp.]